MTTWSIGAPLTTVTRIRRTPYTIAVLPIRGDELRVMIFDPYREQVALCRLEENAPAENDVATLMARATTLTQALRSVAAMMPCPVAVYRVVQRALSTDATTNEERFVFQTKLDDGSEIGIDHDGLLLRLGAQMGRLGRLPFTPKIGRLSADHKTVFAASDSTVAFIDTAPLTILAAEFLRVPYERAQLISLIDLPAESGGGLMLVHQVDEQSIITWLPRRADQTSPPLSETPR